LIRGKLKIMDFNFTCLCGFAQIFCDMLATHHGAIFIKLASQFRDAVGLGHANPKHPL